MKNLTELEVRYVYMVICKYLANKDLDTISTELRMDPVIVSNILDLYNENKLNTLNTFL